MKRLLIRSLAVFLAVNANAYSEEFMNGFYWSWGDGSSSGNAGIHGYVWLGRNYGSSYGCAVRKADNSQVSGDLVIPSVLHGYPVGQMLPEAFKGLSKLTSIAIPDCMKNISTHAFDGCTSLTNVVFGNGVTSIGSYAFSNCTKLESITLPTNIAVIGTGAFMNCRKLKDVFFLGTVPSGITNSCVFDYATNVHYRRKYADMYVGVVPVNKFGGYLVFDDDEFLNIVGQAFSYGDTSWSGDYDVSHDGEGSLRSGNVGNNGESWIETKVNGPVRLSFWWKASSEEYDGEIFDYAYLSLDGEPQGTLTDYQLQGVAIGGKTGWTNVVFDITEEGEHTVRWTYKKDEVDESDVGEDCVWLDEVSLDPLATVSFTLGGGEGTAPAPVNAFMRTKIVLPTTAGFSKAKHTFVGWNDGVETFGAGAEYVVASADVADGGVFQGGTATVSITAEAGAKIRYTLDGSVPTAASVSYDGPLVLDGLSVQIRAIAVRDNYFDSPVAEFAFTRVPEDSADCLNVPGMSLATDVTAPWFEVTGEAARDGVAALRSGGIGDGESSSIEMTVIGTGEIGFWWKSSSEISRNRKYDYVSFLVDGEERSWLGGEKDWKSLTSVAEYEAFRAWADQNNLDHQTVKDSVHAWASFALGANQLFLNEPEIKIEGLSVATSATLPGGGEVGGGQGATRPTMTVFVTVKDGGETVMVNAEKVATMLEATTDLNDWTGAAKVVPVVNDIIRDEYGVMTFSVTPEGSPSSFFLRVRVK